MTGPAKSRTEIRNPKVGFGYRESEMDGASPEVDPPSAIPDTRYPIPNPRTVPAESGIAGRLERTLQVYDESLLRHVAAKLIKPRNQWPVAELIERCLATFDNIASIDRRLKELQPEERRLLALIGHSGQPRWQVVHLIELSACLGDQDGMQSIRNLLESGFLFPEIPENWKRLRSFNQWMTQGGAEGLAVFTHPSVMIRAIGEDLGLPSMPTVSNPVGPILEADGLEWPLRLAAIWQMALSEPLRRTQQGEFFKRDQERLRNDPLLNAPAPEAVSEKANLAFFVTELASALGILRESEGEWRASDFPDPWNKNLPATLASIWNSLPLIGDFQTGEDLSLIKHFPSVTLVFVILLSRIPEDKWGCVQEIQKWIVRKHPGCNQTAYLHATLFDLALSLLFHLGMIQAAKDENGDRIARLTSIGRWLVGLSTQPALPTLPGQTLLVQPNLEIVVYRQGLTPILIVSLSRFAAWKSLGSACLMQLQPETVYRGLESGFGFDRIQQTLAQHGSRPTPPAVLDMLRTWTAKRDRLSIYPAATLFEFSRAEDLNDALARGLPAIRLSDRLAVVTNESAIDYRQFRLTGTRDYGLPPEKCVDVEADGVTLTIEPERSDLLVESELRRFARSLESPGENGRRQYRVTSDSLGDPSGLGIFALEEWFQQRTGQALPPAIRLLMISRFQPPAELKQQLILHVSSSQIADGLMQLPDTRALIQARLGPTALAVAPEQAEELRKRIEQIGLAIQNSSMS
jgi:hypothetical protein